MLVRVSRFGQAIRVEEESLAARERAAELLPLHPGLHPKGIRADAEAVDNLPGSDLHDLRVAGHREDEAAIAFEQHVAA